MLGRLEPTTLVLPPDRVDFEWGDLALQWAVEAGYALDEWQAWFVRESLARRPDLLFAARDIFLEVARQNGKNIALEIIQLFGLLVLGDRLYIHSAHRSDTSHEHFLSLKEHIEDSSFLMGYMPRSRNRGFYEANGKEAIEFKNKARILFKTRSAGSGTIRGPRPQKLFFDETLVLETEVVGTQVPALVAQPNPQVYFTTSPPKIDSEQQHLLRDRAFDYDPQDRYLAAIWNNPSDVDIESEEAIANVNPSYGRGRMTRESLEANRKLMTIADYKREHIGIPEDPPDDAHAPIPIEVWRSLAESTSNAVRDRYWGIGVSMDRKWTTIGVAGRRSDDLVHVEWKVRKPGTAWVIDEAVKAYESLGPCRIHSSGASASLIKSLNRAGVERCGIDPNDPEQFVEELPTSEMARATGMLIDLVASNGLRHLGQQSLEEAISVAKLRVTTDGAKMWAPKGSDGPIDCLLAITAALTGLDELEEDDSDELWVY